jgi:phosphatidylserine decarboxylase
MSIGHTPDTESYKPDMKKEASQVTAQEKEEARRRIEGAGDAGHGVGDNEMPDAAAHMS